MNSFRVTKNLGVAVPSDQIEFAQRVATWSLRRIQPTRWNELWYPVRGHPDDPFLFVNLRVMKRAQQTAIAVASSAEITFPEFDVMRIGPVRRAVATRPGANAINLEAVAD